MLKIFLDSQENFFDDNPFLAIFDLRKDNDIQKQLSKMLIKARHLCCAFTFLIQSYFYFPKILRKQITNITIFKPKNTEEFISLSKELMNVKQDDALIIFNFVFTNDIITLIMY